MNAHMSFAYFFKDYDLYTYAFELSKRVSEGHICFDINDFNKNFDNHFEDFLKNIDSETDVKKYYKKIDIKDLQKNPMVAMASNSDNVKKRPFIISGSNIYLQRYYVYETNIIEKIKTIMNTKNNNSYKEELIKNKEFIKSLFDKIDTQNIDWQLMAMLNSIINNISIITGGPGTGKTFTVAKLLTILLKLDINQSIIMTAPTGKATARLKESLDNAIKTNTNIDQKIENKLNNIEAKTIHSLLGYQNGTHRFKHDKNNPLKYDIIIADEASMIDVSLMSKLFDAIKENGKFILLGDKNQLSSVEAGSIFGDLCSLGENNKYFKRDVVDIYKTLCNVKTGNIDNISYCNNKFISAVCELTVSRRFDDKSDIGKLSKSIINGENITKDLMDSNEVEFITEKEEAFNLFKKYKNYINKENRIDKLTEFDKFRILCATNEGEFGIRSINQKVEESLKLNEKKDVFYKNQPIIIRKNNKNLDIYNGDIGIVDKSKNNILELILSNKKEPIPVAMLPECETSFAITIHKSQGSDYDTVLIFLPEKENKILSRELLYTAITRAKKQVIIYGSDKIIQSAINNRVHRASGIINRLADITF